MQISTHRPWAFAEFATAIITEGRGAPPVSFYVAAAKAWRAPTVSWHAAPHQRCNKSIFILTPARLHPPPSHPIPPHLLLPFLSTSLLPVGSFSQAHFCLPLQSWDGFDFWMRTGGERLKSAQHSHSFSIPLQLRWSWRGGNSKMSFSLTLKPRSGVLFRLTDRLSCWNLTDLVTSHAESAVTKTYSIQYPVNNRKKS